MKKALYLLAELSDRDFDWLVTAGRKQKIAANTTLIREGEPTSALYLVLEGTFNVQTTALDDNVLATLSIGEIMGEMSFVDARPPSATVKAAEDSLVWSIPRAELMNKLRRDNEFAANFYQSIAVFLSDRLRATVQYFGGDQALPPEASSQLENGQEEVNPEIARTLELAKVKLEWLLSRLKDA